jgi:hypothetical protein
LAARSTSASAHTIIGSLPPSSSETGVNVRAARSITALPVRVEPVNITKSDSSITASPVSRAPVATWSTPAGIPLALIISAVRSAVSGVTSEGFINTALPAISAGTTPLTEVR